MAGSHPEKPHVTWKVTGRATAAETCTPSVSSPGWGLGASPLSWSVSTVLGAGAKHWRSVFNSLQAAQSNDGSGT